MRVLVTGATGLLGKEVVNSLSRGGHGVVPLSRNEFDISNPVSAGRILAEEFGKLDAVVNCAAYTKVDQAETEVDLAFEVNAQGPGFLAQSCAIEGIPLVHFSTDYVFDGQASTPYDEDAPTSPQCTYGRSKLEGEQAVLHHHANAYVLRTSWLFSPRAKCFARTIWDRWGTGESLRVVTDQTGSPTYGPFLADLARRLLEDKIDPGLYHAGGQDPMTWYEFALQVIRAATDLPETEIRERLHPISSSEWPTPAVRPPYSVLDSSKLGRLIAPMPPIADALADFAACLRSSKE